MAERRVAMCAENEALASYLFHKWQEMAKNEKFPENTQITLSKAYKNLCDFKDPIRDLRDAKNIKGIGRWTLTLIKDFFKSDDDAIPSIQETTSGQTDKPTKNSRRYLPQKGSAPYAILITLYTETVHKGKEFMRKQELIDAAEISGLSKNAIGPSKSGAPSGNFGAQVKDWYCGWNSMKTLVAKGLVVKSSCPAKYMLTEEGIKTGQECAQRSGLISEAESMILSQPCIESCLADVIPVVEFPSAGNIEAEKPTNSKRRPRIKPCTTKRTFSTSSEDRQIEMLSGAADKNQSSDTSDELMPSFQNEYSIYSSQLKCNERDNTKSTVDHSRTDVPESTLRPDNVMTEVRPCTFTTFQEDPSLNVESNIDSIQSSSVVMLATPPLENNCFSETYNVILLLDDREQFAHDKRGNNSRSKVAEHLHSMFNIEVEVRRLPIGDASWIARHKTFGQEYVLDFIVERKKVNDLSISIKDNRYRDQKLRLMRCGIQRLIYLIEGDPNLIDASESIKSAAMTTEILEGFDVQRTKDLSATIRKYGNLTKAIAEVYNMISLNRNQYKSKPCMTYDGFVEKCRDLTKETVSDVFGVQLMQVPQVTEDIALAILDHYPTVLSLAKAYASLEGDKLGQENLLKDIPIRNKSKTIGSTASKRIYNLIWGDGQ